jgi:hypothetical protein
VQPRTKIDYDIDSNNNNGTLMYMGEYLWGSPRGEWAKGNEGKKLEECCIYTYEDSKRTKRSAKGEGREKEMGV